MDYLSFEEGYFDEYRTNSNLLKHSRISPINRARLFSWLCQECSKQRMSRYTYALTCSYIDLYFMKKNDVSLKDYQLLALGALILASKQIQIEGKFPIIDFKLFKPDQLLNMQKKIIYALDFYLNPPIYVQLLNNIAQIWDNKCLNKQINSKIQYLAQTKDSYLRMKSLYEKMDCLILFQKNLDFDMKSLIVTLFYLQTKKNQEESLKLNNSQEFQNVQVNNNRSQKSQFEQKFNIFLQISQIQVKPCKRIQFTLQKLCMQNYLINDRFPEEGLKRTYTELLSIQTFNDNAYEFYKKKCQQINQI